MAKIFQFCITNPGYSPTITHNLCLDLEDIISLSIQPGFNQLILNIHRRCLS